MRPDMHEVVIERPRRGSRTKFPQPAFDRHTLDDDDPPVTWMPVSRRRGSKSLSDLLGPLRRFLRGAVGRPWDDVYSEIRANLRMDTEIHRHILEHVRREVEVTPRLDGRRPARLYVCPETGILRHAESGWYDVRDPRRGDHVTLRRFLLRRLGEDWRDVAAQVEAVRPGWAWAERLVSLDVRRRFGHRGRVHAWVAASEERPAHLGAVLVRGRMYVEDGELKVVR